MEISGIKPHWWNTQIHKKEMKKLSLQKAKSPLVEKKQVCIIPLVENARIWQKGKTVWSYLDDLLRLIQQNIGILIKMPPDISVIF